MKSVFVAVVILLVSSFPSHSFAQNGVSAEVKAGVLRNRNTLNEFIRKYNALKTEVDEIKNRQRNLGGPSTANGGIVASPATIATGMPAYVFIPVSAAAAPAPPASSPPVTARQESLIASDPVQQAIAEHKARLEKLEENDTKQDGRLDALEAWQKVAEKRFEKLENVSDETDVALLDAVSNLNERFKQIESQFNNPPSGVPTRRISHRR